jgi:hypothetical protein
MPSVKNIDELRDNCLRMLDDIVGGSVKTTGDSEERETTTLIHYNNQVKNVISICSLELKYAQLTGKSKIKFMEYEHKNS